MENKTTIKTGDIIAKNNTYKTRDIVSAIQLARLATAMKEWKLANASNQTAAIQRKVKAIGEVL
jgi:hypothetical protein